ncbi:hypothetical protein [Methylobacterium trifolii]|uniref:Secreted protein n=1 Tax=Methylobacterium trifolii TaxID=1003092 RepID=A0ABQ4TWA4_9HYPH|nr:hypothetical protein [Methylobacterium trifolii]GJE59551.1 hypothetical protein MPOCJGCO_1647 [Methylobacterium trifolii]
MTRFDRVALVLLVAAPIAGAVPAAAQSPAKSYLFQERQFSRFCPPGLKYAAGACVRRCPAGFEDNGRTCRQRSMRGGRW